MKEGVVWWGGEGGMRGKKSEDVIGRRKGVTDRNGDCNGKRRRRRERTKGVAVRRRGKKEVEEKNSVPQVEKKASLPEENEEERTEERRKGGKWRERVLCLRKGKKEGKISVSVVEGREERMQGVLESVEKRVW